LYWIITLINEKLYNNTNLSFDLQRSSTAVFDSNPLNKIAPEKISVTPKKLSTASETHCAKQLASLNGLKSNDFNLTSLDVKGKKILKFV
jgi:hypothetical protein